MSIFITNDSIKSKTDETQLNVRSIRKHFKNGMIFLLVIIINLVVDKCGFSIYTKKKKKPLHNEAVKLIVLPKESFNKIAPHHTSSR